MHYRYSNKKRKQFRKHAKHDKKHRMAAATPENQKAIQSLRREWKEITAVERGDRVLQLQNKGCSLRGVARDVHVSEKIVRMSIDTARLPEQYRQLIQGGASPKRVLTMKKAKDHVSPRQLRVQLEQKNGRPSTDRANQFAWFVLAYIASVCTSWMSIHRFLQETEDRIFLGRPLRYNGGLKSGSGQEIGVRRAAKLAWPKPEKISFYYDRDEIDDKYQAFTNFVVIMEGNKLIRENAFAKFSNLLTRFVVKDVGLVQEVAMKLSARALGKFLRHCPENLNAEALSPLVTE